jgi:hypothetical protein
MKPFTSTAVKKAIHEFFNIYYGTVFFVYSTSIIISFWEFPTLLQRFSISDTVGFFSYQLAFSFVESVIMAFFTLILVYLIPLKWIGHRRAEIGGLLIISFTIASLLFKVRKTLLNWLIITFSLSATDSEQIVLFIWFFTIFSLPIISVMLIKIEKLAISINTFLENSSVLAFSYTVLSWIGIIIVIFRNWA